MTRMSTARPAGDPGTTSPRHDSRRCSRHEHCVASAAMTYARIALAVALLVPACGKTGSDRSEKSAAELAAKQPLTAQLFGKTAGPFGPLVKLSWGCTEAQAKAAVPE